MSELDELVERSYPLRNRVTLDYERQGREQLYEDFQRVFSLVDALREENASLLAALKDERERVTVAIRKSLIEAKKARMETRADTAYWNGVWFWRARLPERKGQRCRVTARGALNSIRVEFPDGFWTITSRWAVRRVA